MRIALLVSLVLGWSLGVLQAQSGLTVEVVPPQVKPGELFELRVTMDREEFGRFELKVPGHEHLHRVAREEVPVKLEDGRYRQQERWVLQADSSGEFVIEKALAKLETKAGIEEVALPEIRIEVLPYAAMDGNADPLDFPEDDAASVSGGQVGWIVGGVIMALGCWWWMLKSNRTGVVDQVAEKSEDDRMLDRLATGELDPKDLERLMSERDWSDAAKEALAEVVYGGGKDVARLVEILRKEAAR